MIWFCQPKKYPNNGTTKRESLLPNIQVGGNLDRDAFVGETLSFSVTSKFQDSENGSCYPI